MPLSTIMRVAKTVSRARTSLPALAASIMEMISATSITVTATASTIEPNGSPSRWAMISAWCTEANTAATRRAAAARSTTTDDDGASPVHVPSRRRQAATGAAHAQIGIRCAA